MKALNVITRLSYAMALLEEEGENLTAMIAAPISGFWPSASPGALAVISG